MPYLFHPVYVISIHTVLHLCCWHLHPTSSLLLPFLLSHISDATLIHCHIYCCSHMPSLSSHISTSSCISPLHFPAPLLLLYFCYCVSAMPLLPLSLLSYTSTTTIDTVPCIYCCILHHSVSYFPLPFPGVSAATIIFRFHHPLYLPMATLLSFIYDPAGIFPNICSRHHPLLLDRISTTTVKFPYLWISENLLSTPHSCSQYMVLSTILDPLWLLHYSLLSQIYTVCSSLLWFSLLVPILSYRSA